MTDHGFPGWVAALIGEIGAVTETGFKLANAAVQVFEKKAREVDAVAKEKAGDGQKGTVTVDGNEKGDDGVDKRKSLLDGVRMK